MELLITVSSADEALERARELGATVHAPAFDVLDAGRMGVVQDPQGAYFMVWEPRANIGAGLVNAHGALSWNELASPIPRGRRASTPDCSGGARRRWTDVDPPYLVIKRGDGLTNGGIRAAASTEPCYWLVYFGTDDLEGTLAKVQELGGDSLVGPIAIGPGRFAAVQDPQGAVFALYTGDFDQ